MGKRYTVHVAINDTADRHAIWPLLWDHAEGRFWVGSMVRPAWPFTVEELGSAVAWAAEFPGVTHLRVAREPLDEEVRGEGGGGWSACPGDVGARDSF